MCNWTKWWVFSAGGWDYDVFSVGHNEQEQVRIMDRLWLDYESRSRVSLDERGLDNYAHDPSTEILLCAYAFGDKAPKLWQPHLDPQIPAELEDALLDPFVQCWSWNATFRAHHNRMRS